MASAVFSEDPSSGDRMFAAQRTKHFLPAGPWFDTQCQPRVESQADNSVSTPVQEGPVTFHVKGPERVFYRSLGL